MNTNESLRTRLASYERTNEDYWSFRGNAAREHTHAYFQYPAMMVPQMQAELLKAAVESDASIKHIYDPFVGSGTALTEAMMQGLDFTGQDINPLAILLCRAKSIPHYCSALEAKVDQVLNRIWKDNSRALEGSFPNRRKWFRNDVAIHLSRIRRAIRVEPSLWARRFLWVAMAETVRLSSNSRTTTFKLHIRPESERETRVIDSVEIFRSKCERNLANLNQQRNLLAKRGLLRRGHYCGNVITRLADSRDAASGAGSSKKFDLLLTSPPYGDNVSTVPYGQHSYLPLQWIDSEDIDTEFDPDCLATTHEIDSRSLGGSRVVSQFDINRLRDASPTYAKTHRLLRKEPSDRCQRLSAFCRDLERSLVSVTQEIRPNGLMFWIIGNRQIGGRVVPLDNILVELLESIDVRFLFKIDRTIPTKRIALRNNIAKTMRRETVVVMRTQHERPKCHRLPTTAS